MERLLFERHATVLQGAVLELIPGGSQFTGELVNQARSYTGVGPSAAVIGVCRQVYRAGKFVHAEVTDLEQFSEGAFDAVVAGRCALDLLDPERRRVAFERIHRVLGPLGVLIFSSHNLPDQASAPPAEARGRRGGGLRRALRLRSSRSPMDERELGNELLSGIDGEVGGQYQIGRDEQEAQLSELGFRLVECLDLDGQAVPRGSAATDSPELHYVAHLVPSA